MKEYIPKGLLWRYMSENMMEVKVFKSQNVFVEDLHKDLGILMAGNKEGLIATNSKVHVKEASQLVVYVLALFWVQMANLSGGSYLKSKKLLVCVLELGCGATAGWLHFGARAPLHGAAVSSCRVPLQAAVRMLWGLGAAVGAGLLQGAAAFFFLVKLHALWGPVQGTTVGCRCSVLLVLSECCTFRLGRWHQGAAAAGCRCRLLCTVCSRALLECCPRFGAWMLVPLKGGCCCQRAVRFGLWCWWRCRVSLQSSAVRVLCALWGLGARKAALHLCWCRCRVLLSECCARFEPWAFVPLLLLSECCHCRVLRAAECFMLFGA